ncbi:YIP1 family protein [Pseudobowmanella zhangzhouensis]|uniref:YIP1 family protein n=1 Tax=Pseudobowmanella zhangzhouensis TaxID=1537679 RepID=UPI00360D5962
MTTVTNPLQACTEIFFKPNGVFATLKTTHNWSWVPFFLVIVLAALLTYLYWGFVDFEWIKGQIVASVESDMSPAQIQGMKDSMSAKTYQLGSAIGGPIMIIIINAVIALYLSLATKIDQDNVQGYTDWYGFTWWTAMPMILGGLVAMAIIVTADNHQLAPGALSPTSLAFVAGIGFTDNWFGWANGIKLEVLWSIYLTAAGISQWTNIKGGKAWLIAAAPTVLIYGIWAAFKMI